jgi:membrane-associated phospholipid phosphatase
LGTVTKNARTALLASVLVVAAASAGLAYQRTASAGAPAPAATPGAGSGALVVEWNRELVHILNTPGAQPAAIHPTRSLAIMHAAVYDAVVATTAGGSPYMFGPVASRGARPDVAAATAAHDTLLALYPAWKNELDSQLAAELAGVADGPNRQAGARVGTLTAQAMLGIRVNDGSAAPPPPLPAGAQPGGYRPTPPGFAAPVFTQWAKVTPFVLRRADQFRPPAPNLATDEYTQALTEVFRAGEDSSRFRTADQTVTARFWPGPIWVTWNEIAEKAATAHHTDLAATTRLFADLNFAIADTTIAFYDAKYTYQVARPITAIRAVGSEAQWTPLLTTAPDPSYPGAHSAVSAAAATVLARFFGDHDRFTATSDALPGVTRNFDSYGAAATEAGLSRIYGGVHTRIDHDAGMVLGHDVASAVLRSAASGWS